MSNWLLHPRTPEEISMWSRVMLAWRQGHEKRVLTAKITMRKIAYAAKYWGIKRQPCNYEVWKFWRDT